MLAGVDIVHARPGYEARFLRCVLETVRGLQTNTRFVLFTDAATHGFYEGWTRVNVEEEGRSLFSGGSMVQAAKNAKVDIILAPLATAPVNSPIPQVLYALDLAQWEKDPETGKACASSKIKVAKKACAEARALFVASESMRRRCLELFDAPIDKTVVGPVGVDPVFGIVQKSLLRDPYLMLIADFASAPHLPFLCELLTKREKGLPATLVIAGPALDNEPVRWGPGIIRVDQCPDTVLASLYRHAVAFLYPAPHDGSAMRVLEALRAGALVVTPNAGTICELAGDAPFYYNPANPSSVVQTVRRVIDLDAPQRQQRIHLGQGVAAKYSWDKTAWRLLSALKR